MPPKQAIMEINNVGAEIRSEKKGVAALDHNYLDIIVVKNAFPVIPFMNDTGGCYNKGNMCENYLKLRSCKISFRL